MILSKSKSIILASTLSASALLWSCAGGINLFSKSEDVQLGQQMAQKIAADPAHYPILNNPQLTAYLQSIEDRIVQSPNVQNKDFHYKVTIINDPKTINAFTIPGGGIYVYTGLLKFINDESALAGVLAHEMGHIAHHDGAKGVIERGAASMVFGKMLGHFAGGDAASNAANQVMRLSYSRDVEDAADAFGGAVMSKVGGDPRANGYLLERGVKESDLPPHFLLSHAEPKRRSANLARVAPPEVHRELLTSQEFAALKKICS